MKFSVLKKTPMVVNELKGKLYETIETVEHNEINSTYRIIFKDLELPAYIIYQAGVYKALHYCESNENGLNCKHLNVFAAIGDVIGIDIDKVSIASGLKELNPIFDTLNLQPYININHKFGLLEPIDYEEEVESTLEEPVITTPSAVVSPVTSRNWKTGWGDVQTYLTREGITPTLINRVRKRREEVHATVSCLPMMIAPKKPPFPYSGDMLARALSHVSLGKDLLLIGGKGTGKDTLISTIGWVLGLPQSIHVGNKDESKESIVGESAFRDGESTFDLSQFAMTVQNGGIANMSEINMLLGDVTSIYHSLLDENEVLATPVGAIKRHPHFVMMGSMNVGEGYVGARALNDAFKDRFCVLRLPYTANFKEMISQKTGLVDNAQLNFLEKIKKAVETLISEENQGHAASTIRGYIDAARYFLEIGFSRDTQYVIIEDYILNKIEDNDEYMSLRQMIREVACPDLPISLEEEEYIKGGS